MDIPANNIPDQNSYQDTFVGCLEQCVAYNTRTGQTNCQGVAWDELVHGVDHDKNTQRCWLKNNALVLSYTSPDLQTVISAQFIGNIN